MGCMCIGLSTLDCILYTVYGITCIVHGIPSSGSHFVPGGSGGRSLPRILYTVYLCNV